ncbi:rootletin [Culicoides brevitarsis]|uniref:rootletin n=1 Tax=Culicoides brevitarsis TaxID=469753 RepID=UPI00307C1155
MDDVTKDLPAVVNQVRILSEQKKKLQTCEFVQLEKNNYDIHNQLAGLNEHYNKLKVDLCDRENAFNCLQREYELLKRKYDELRCHAETTYTVIGESQHLQNALTEIARSIVSDFNNDNQKPFDSVLESFARKVRFNQNMDYRSLAESTTLAVQATISNYNKSINENQNKLQELSNEISKLKAHVNELSDEKINFLRELPRLNEKCEEQQLTISELVKEKENLQYNLESIRSEKFTLDQMMSDITLTNEKLSNELNKKELVLSKLQKELDNIEEEKAHLQDDIKNNLKKEELHYMTLNGLEMGNSRLKEEILLLQEELHKTCLKSDVLEHQLSDEKLSNSKYENEIRNLKNMLDTVSKECCTLKTELDNALLVKENGQKANKLHTDIDILKKELIGSEKIRLQIESEKKNLEDKLSCAHNNNSKLEELLCQTQKEREELCNKLTVANRKNDFLNTELLRFKQRIEQATQINNRLNKNIEELIKQNESKQSFIEKLEKDIETYQEIITTLKTEKNALEGRLHDSLSTIDNNEHKLAQLNEKYKEKSENYEKAMNQLQLTKREFEMSEKNLANLKIKFSSDISKLEGDFVQKLSKLKQLIDDNIVQFNAEKAHLQSTSEKRLQQALHDLELEKNTEIEKIKIKYNSLQDQHTAFIQQHEEMLLKAENEKQNVYNCAQKDKQHIVLRLEQALQDLEKEAENHSKTKREAKCQHDQDKRLISSLRDECVSLKNELENLRLHLEDVKHASDTLVSKLNDEKESLFKEISELKTVTKLEEDKSNALKIKSNELSMRLNEAESLIEGLRKELMDYRKQITDISLERNTFAESAKALRENVKQLETTKREMKKTLDNNNNKIMQLEDTNKRVLEQCNDLSKRLQDSEIESAKIKTSLSHKKDECDKMKVTISEKDILEKELRSRLNNETEERERLSHQLIHATKQITDLEGLLNSARQELHHTICQTNQERHKWSNFEHGLQNQYEETRINEQKLQDKKHNLEICLADATQQIQELKAKISGLDNKNCSLEKERTFLLERKRSLENKLSTISSMLRCICGIQPDGSIIIPGHHVLQSGMDRSANHESIDMFIIEPDQATIGMKALMHYIGQLERDQEALASKLSVAEKKLLQSSEQEKRIENKLNKIQVLLNTTQHEKVNAETKYSQKSAALKNVEAALKSKCDEVRILHENKSQLENAIHDINLSKKHLEDHLEQCRQAISCLETENNSVKDELAHAEAKLSRLDLQKIALEGDLQRHQMILQDKDNSIKMLQEKVENQSKCIASLEECCANMKLTIDQLKSKIEQSAVLEAELRAEIKHVQKIKSNQEQMLINCDEKNKQLQKALLNSENEQRILSERLESAQQNVAETKRQNQSIATQLQKYQEQVANLEIQKSNIDSQLKLLQWKGTNEDSNRYDNSSFSNKMDKDFEVDSRPNHYGEFVQSDIQQNKKISSLENELMMLKKQLQQEVSWKDKYDCIKNKTSQELIHLRKALGSSLKNVALDPHASMIRTESKWLDNAVSVSLPPS